ncbi:uncharacterized protein RAG0_16044 [Rhynchosporium agropyri]|uniref:Uncharacterized protein n=1 Tax=Rhynchosporium agropyri TaxID=914238 RepID=A0A1E1LNJ5_9HELO|nr:uncharacterized protein RAG0_16044 [Rhynchosporium agropyri]
MEVYTSQEAAIIAKAHQNGIHAHELDAIFERILAKVTKEYGGSSANFKLGRAEQGSWMHFFPGEPFPTENSKPQSAYEGAARRDWVHDRYQSESPEHPEIPTKIDSYRPQTDIDSYRPALGTKSPLSEENRSPTGPASKLARSRMILPRQDEEKKDGRVLKPLQVNGRTFERRANWDPSLSPPKNGAVRYCSQVEVIKRRASESGISMLKIEDSFEEKATITEKKYADCSRDWQMFFVEIGVWIRYFTDPFPGVEPLKHVEAAVAVAQDNRNTEIECHQKITRLSPYTPQLSEAMMEALAIREGLRKEFFQYLQRMRDYSRIEHKGENCRFIRGWFADNLAWQNFFGPKPFPFAQPYGKLNPRCTHCMLLPKFAPVKVASRDGRSQASQVTSRGELTTSAGANRTPPVQAGSIIPALKSTQGSSTDLHPLGALILRRSLRTPPPWAPVSKRPEADFHPQSPPPLAMTTQLALMWSRDPFMGKGTVIMQNTLITIYNKTFIGKLFNCFMSDKKHKIAAIGAELKCHIHYYVTSTGDLFLWTEPQIPGDAISFKRGHAFITGWVARVGSFGMVKPSLHWNAIRIPLAPLQAQQAPILAPVKAEDTLRRLSSYVQAATAERNLPIPDTICPSAFENPEKQWEKYQAAFQTSDIDRLMIEEAVKKEGDLRMVLDKESREVVSVEELIRRTVARCTVTDGPQSFSKVIQRVDDIATHLGGKKRKAEADNSEDEEGRREEKRACV